MCNRRPFFRNRTRTRLHLLKRHSNRTRTRPTLYNGWYVAVAFPLHHSVGPTLYNGWYTVAVAFTPHDSAGPTMLRSRLHFRHITPFGQRCIMVVTVAVAFPSHDCVGPTLYNGC